MATLVFSAVGTLLGGPVGGAIGALAGRQVDQTLFGGNIQGPRLKELAVTASTYGEAIPRHFGKMRVPGSIIWATDLVEHSQTSGGKGRPSVTTYTYTASFAVALASRPILGIGRIWADGNLLRGEAGDLKAQGQLRIYTGEHDQPADPFIQQVEGASLCPAFRGLAYVMFQDLDLGDFYNRVPALTFEVFADDGTLSVHSILEGALDDFNADLPLPGIDGFSSEGPVNETLSMLDPLFPMDCDASSDVLVIARERLQSEAIALPEAAISVADGGFGGRSGYARRREPAPPAPPEVLRYYDIARDYQPGMQKAGGRARGGQPRIVELPAALTAQNARMLADKMARQSGWSRDTLAWRTAELDPATGPGAIVTVPDQPGRWRVSDWEWRDKGVELTLKRIVAASIETAAAGAGTPADPGRTIPPTDTPAPPSMLAAAELPWDGTGSADSAFTVAAVSSTGASWAGAALFVDHGDGNLLALGTSSRSRSTIGTAIDALPFANPLLFDRTATVTVELLAADMTLTDSTVHQLAMGANRALLGDELIQFARAIPLGNGRWRLEGLLRASGGTETAMGGHAAGERFILLDGTPIALDPAKVGTASSTLIAAAGRGDSTPVVSPIAQQGITLRPLSPVHGRAFLATDGSLDLAWTRRARGGWAWLDGVDVPLREQDETYVVTFGPLAAPIATWEVTQPALVVDAPTISSLSSSAPGEAFRVRQRGTFALSEPLLLATLP